MFKLFRRAMAKAAKRAASANVRAATKALREQAAPRARPPRKRPAAAKLVKADPAKPRVRKPKAIGKLRRGLAETIAWIEAGGMPARPTAARTKTAVPPSASFQLASYASDQGKLSYKLYIPANAKVGPQPCAPMPLVVMLHGCGQTPDDFAAGPRMNALAEEFGLLVAYPSQPRAANANRSWNWFERSDQVRGTGEPSLIAGRTRTILRDHPADPMRVSAAIIAATAYPISSRRWACIPGCLWEPRAMRHRGFLPCDRARRATGQPSRCRPSSFTGMPTPWCIPETAGSSLQGPCPHSLG